MLAFRLPLLAAALLVTASHASAAVVFTEHFPIQNGNVASHGWRASHSATNIDISNLANPASNTVNYRAGSIVNNGAAGDPANVGYLYAQSYARAETTGTVTTPATNYFLYTTSEVTSPISLLNQQELRVDWQQSASNSNVGVRFAIQLNNGSWYVDSTPNANASGSSATNFSAQSENLLTMSWNALNFSAGSMGVVNGTLTYSQLIALGTNITGIGFYIDNLPSANATKTETGPVGESYITMRLDQVIINATAVPEPQLALLLGLGFMGLLMNRKRQAGRVA